ncbi:MAG: rRNA ((2251)-2-O)-methyltransferase RlmB [Bacteroidota bacterium]|jgi:tRNA G18 (ribose-2'-O)-methylase SpoU
MRTKTRRKRYNEKIANGFVTNFPISLCAINFQCDENLAYLIRTAACFGSENLHVIGSLPNYEELRRKSGTLNHYVNMHQYSTPSQFLDYARQTKMKVISAELDDEAKNIHSYDFVDAVTRHGHICIVVGNETTGVPTEILANSEKIYIPMPGAGFCLNTSQTANIMMYEAVKQITNSSFALKAKVRYGYDTAVFHD